MSKEQEIVIEQTNAMMARFMELQTRHTLEPNTWEVFLNNCWQPMLYHKSWDWLMPVVQKILNADMDTFDSYALWISDSLRTADISQVYSAVINFLEQDNARY